MTEKFTGRLADFGAADLALAGGKGANLGELVRHGFPVPAGLLVTTAAYAAVLAETGLGAELEGSPEAGGAAARIRAPFSAARIPARVSADIAAAYAALGGGPVAVRSSATAEDLPGAAFAGQQDTFLNVVGEQAVLRAVAECWASLWTDRAIAYRQRQGINPREVSIAVVVQDMVPADTAGVTGLRISYLPGAFVPQLKLRLMLILLGKRRLGPALIAGAETRTGDANRALEELAGQVRSQGGLARAFAGLAPADLLSRLARDSEFKDFQARFRAFLAEYGHRETLSVVMSSAPTWSDAPEVVLGLITSMTGERRPAADQAGQALAELQRHPALRIAPVRRRLLSAVDAARAGTAFREDSHFYATMVLPPLRRALSELGRRLCEAGVLADPAEVNHLRFEELAGMDDGGVLAAAERERFRRLVLARAAKRRELEGIPLLDPAALFAHRRPGPGTLVSGAPASGGQATGRVRIIRGPEEFGLLRSGEVLVCPYTNPSWTPLFRRAAALVVDAGGIASHAAIVAREYGIPAVTGTGSGTGALQDGQLVLVDGTRGQVTAAAAQPPP